METSKSIFLYINGRYTLNFSKSEKDLLVGIECLGAGHYFHLPRVAIQPLIEALTNFLKDK